MCTTAASKMSMEDDSPNQPENNTSMLLDVDTKEIDQYGLMIPGSVDSECDRKPPNVKKQMGPTLSPVKRKPSQPASNLYSHVSISVVLDL